MPRRFMFTKEEILNAALDLTREKGFSAVSARSLGEKLGTSSRPIFSHYKNMADVQNAIIEAANGIYQSYLKEDMASGKYPPYKASGMAYIRFAREERELFKMLFMCDRSKESIAEDRESIRPLLEIIQKNLDVNEDDAFMFHLEMWIYAHGIATMIATSYLSWDDTFISKLLTEAYLGMKNRYMEGEKHVSN